MSMFDPVPYETTMEARDVMDVAAGRATSATPESLRGLASMVAGAAVALESGGADIGRRRQTSAEEWLDPTRFDGAMLHRALGRVLNQVHAQGAELEMTPKSVIESLVTDVSLQSVAGVQVMRGGPVPLNPSQQEDREYVARGRFDQLSAEGRTKVLGDMSASEYVPAVVKAEIDAVASVVSRDHAGMAAHSRHITARIADFSEAPDQSPLFRDMKTPENEPLYERALTRSFELMVGRGAQPTGPAELAVAAHVRGVGGIGNGRIANEARARLLVEGLEEGADIGRAARSIEGEVAAVGAASREMHDAIERGGPSRKADVIAYGRFNVLGEREQPEIYRAMQYAEGVSPLVGMRIERAADAIQEEARERVVERGADMATGRGRDASRRVSGAALAASADNGLG